LGHTVPPFLLRDGAATHEHGEQRIGVIPQKESYFPPPDRRVEYRKVKVGINSRPRSDKDVHIGQGRHFRARLLL
jgi:hypothetical protein